MGTQHAFQACLNCGKEMDSEMHVGPDDPAPSPGDIAICFYCHHLMAFASDLSYHALTDQETIEVAGDPELLRAMRALAAFGGSC